MPNKEYNAKYNDKEPSPPKEMKKTGHAAYKDKVRKIPKMGPKRPAYESSAKKVKTHVFEDY